MKPSISICLFLAVILISGCATSNPGYVHTQGTQVVDASGRPVMQRGINLGNWLLPEGYMFKFEKAAAPWQIRQVFAELVGPVEAEEFWRKWYDSYITREDIHEIKQLGFDHIRVPFNYKLLTPEDEPGVWEGPGFELLDRVIGWARDEDIHVVLDMHGAPCGQTGSNIDDSIGHPWLFESEACKERTADVWRKIASRYRNDKTVIGYDLLNEPIPHYEGYAERFNHQLEPLYKRITTAIREVDPNHMIILGGAQWDSNFKVFGAPFDKNVVYTFHKYWTAPTPEVIKEYVEYRDRYNVPLWMSESGENNDEWIRQFTNTLEDEKIGWAYWPYKKMDATSCVRSIDRPAHWDQIVAYEKLFGASFDEKRAARPSLEASRAALNGLLENLQFARTRRNPGYVAALGLTSGTTN